VKNNNKKLNIESIEYYILLYALPRHLGIGISTKSLKSHGRESKLAEVVVENHDIIIIPNNINNLRYCVCGYGRIHNLNHHKIIFFKC